MSNILFPNFYPKVNKQALVEKITHPEVSEINTEAIFSYHDPLVRRAIWELKFRGSLVQARMFAEILHDEILGFISEKSAFLGNSVPLVLPIPSYKKRLKQKGFNQVFLLADALSFIDKNQNFEVSKDVLYKIKDTGTQISLKDRRARLQNLKNAFAVQNSEKIKNRTLILIDDVTTTGTTFKEASTVLINTGAKEVHCFALAH